MRVCVLTVLVACGGSPPRDVPKQATVTTTTPRAHREQIVPAMLADPGVLDRLPQRVRLARVGADREPPSKPLPVLAQAKDKIRVVGERDDARIAEWIEVADVATVATAEAQLTDQGGAASRDVGIWVRPGAVLMLRTPGVDNHQVSVKTFAFAFPDLWLPKRAIGIVFVPAPAPPPATVTLASYEPLRAAPDENAAIVVDTTSSSGVTVLETRGAWRRVEVERDRVRVRGWVPAAVLRDEAPEDGTIELGSIYTVSHAGRIDVPAGACLYDRPEGEVIGVNTRTRSRLGTRRDGNWQSVYVDTTWALRTLVVRVDGDKVESCLP